jgi:hypothetical protein
VGTPEQVLAYRDLGFTFLGCSSDSGLLAVGARQLAGRLLALKDQADVDRVPKGEARPS